MALLDQVLKQHVTPVLAAAGFRRHGREYSLVATNGDHVFVKFAKVLGQDNFTVRASALPASYWDWLCHTSPGLESTRPDADTGSYFWSYKVWPPTDGHWSFTDDAGQVLAELLATDLAPLLRPLLDRRQFLALNRDPGKPLRNTVDEVPLLVDDGPSADLAAALAVLDARDPTDFPYARTYADWARGRNTHAVS